MPYIGMPLIVFSFNYDSRAKSCDAIRVAHLVLPTDADKHRQTSTNSFRQRVFGVCFTDCFWFHVISISHATPISLTIPSNASNLRLFVSIVRFPCCSQTVPVLQLRVWANCFGTPSCTAHTFLIRKLVRFVTTVGVCVYNLSWQNPVESGKLYR